MKAEAVNSFDARMMKAIAREARLSPCSHGAGALVLSADKLHAWLGHTAAPPALLLAQSGRPCREWCKRAAEPTLRLGQPTHEDCPTTHAEAMALGRCGPTRARNGWLYVTKSPCLTCAKMAAAFGIERVIWQHHRNREDSTSFIYLNANCVKVTVLSL